MVDRLRVRVLGAFLVEGVVERALGSRKARRLLKILAVAHGGPVSVDRIADILWGDDPPARPADQVGVLVSRLRGVLGAERLVRTDAGYTLKVDWLDIDELAARVAEAEDALGEGRLGAARAAAKAASALARGPVLSEEDGSWVEVERAAVEVLCASARRIAAEAAGRSGDHVAAAAAAEQALVHDPYDEASLRVLMRAHSAAGRPASALAAYVRVREQLADALGISPAAETEILHDAIVLDDLRPDARPPSRLVPPKLVGRDAELAALDVRLDRVLAGATLMVAVSGDAGIGKSALLEDWAARAMSRALVLVGRCDPLGRDLPLQPVLDAVAEHLAARSAEERLALIGAEATLLGPLLGVGTVVAVGGATKVMDAELDRARWFGALLGVVGRLAEGRPAVIVIDDLHLAGSSTLAWLRFATLRSSRLMVVVSARPTSDSLVSSDMTNVTLTLGPIDVEAVAALVGPSKAFELHARSGGHPLLLRALLEDADEGPPLSVQEAVERRVGGLGQGAATIRSAAVLGGSVDLDVLADVMRAPAVELLEHLEAAVAARVLVERGSGFAFLHEFERETLDASVGSARRSLVHREAARALAVRAAPEPLAVAVHARLGGDLTLASAWYLRAAEVAVSRFDLSSAESHLDAAIALNGSAATHVARARVLMAGGRLEEAAGEAARAVAGGAGAPALEVAGWVAYYRRRYQEACEAADEGVAQAADHAIRGSCLALGGRVRHGAGDLAGADTKLGAAVVEESSTGVASLGRVWLAQLRLHQGRPSDALALLDRLRVEPEQLDHPFAALHGRFARVLALGQLGRAGNALTECDELSCAIERAGEVGARMVGPALNARAWILRWTGHPDEADDLNDQAVARADVRGPAGESYYAGLLDLADGRLLNGDTVGAYAVVERLESITTWNGTMAWHQRHRWGLLRARLALADGDHDTAAALSAEVSADAGARGANRYHLIATAVGALAGGEPASDLVRLWEVVRGLAGCAVIDGWPLVVSLATAFEVMAWRATAQRWAGRVIASTPDQEAVRDFAAGILATSR